MNKKEIIILSCQLLNLILLSLLITFYGLPHFMLIGTKKDLFAFTGTIGDTIGGISNPFLGVVSIIFIYKTFTDQKRANFNSKSTNSFNIIIEQIKSLRTHLDRINYKDAETGQIYYGLEAKEKFESSVFYVARNVLQGFNVFHEKRKVYEKTTTADHSILIGVIEFTRNLLFTVEKINNANLNDEDKSSSLWYINDLFEYYRINYSSIVDTIKDSIKDASYDKEDYSLYIDIKNLNYFAHQTLEYDRLIERLQQFNIITILYEKNLTTQEFVKTFDKPDVNSSYLRAIKKYNIKINK